MKDILITKNSTEIEIKEYFKELCTEYKNGSLSIEELSRKSGDIMYSIFHPKKLSEKISGELYDFIWMLDEHAYYTKNYKELNEKFLNSKY